MLLSTCSILVEAILDPPGSGSKQNTLAALLQHHFCRRSARSVCRRAALTDAYYSYSTCSCRFGCYGEMPLALMIALGPVDRKRAQGFVLCWLWDVLGRKLSATTIEERVLANEGVRTWPKHECAWVLPPQTCRPERKTTPNFSPPSLKLCHVLSLCL